MSQDTKFELSELPKKSCSEDEFFISDRLLPRLYDFVMDGSIPHPGQEHQKCLPKD